MGGAAVAAWPGIREVLCTGCKTTKTHKPSSPGSPAGTWQLLRERPKRAAPALCWPQGLRFGRKPPKKDAEPLRCASQPGWCPDSRLGEPDCSLCRGLAALGSGTFGILGSGSLELCSVRLSLVMQRGRVASGSKQDLAWLVRGHCTDRRGATSWVEVDGERSFQVRARLFSTLPAHEIAGNIQDLFSLLFLGGLLLGTELQCALARRCSPCLVPASCTSLPLCGGSVITASCAGQQEGSSYKGQPCVHLCRGRQLRELQQPSCPDLTGLLLLLGAGASTALVWQR